MILRWLGFCYIVALTIQQGNADNILVENFGSTVNEHHYYGKVHNVLNGYSIDSFEILLSNAEWFNCTKSEHGYFYCPFSRYNISGKVSLPLGVRLTANTSDSLIGYDVIKNFTSGYYWHFGSNFRTTTPSSVPTFSPSLAPTLQPIISPAKESIVTTSSSYSSENDNKSANSISTETTLTIIISMIGFVLFCIIIGCVVCVYVHQKNVIERSRNAQRKEVSKPIVNEEMNDEDEDADACTDENCKEKLNIQDVKVMTQKEGDNSFMADLNDGTGNEEEMNKHVEGNVRTGSEMIGKNNVTKKEHERINSEMSSLTETDINEISRWNKFNKNKNVIDPEYYDAPVKAEESTDGGTNDCVIVLPDKHIFI